MKIRIVSHVIAQEASERFDVLEVPCRPIFYDFDPNIKTLAFDTEKGQIHVELNPRELVQLALKCLQERENWEKENFDE